MSDHEGDGGVEEAALSRAEIQRIFAESVAAALRPRGEDVPRAAATPRPPATATSQAGKLGGYGRGWGVRGPSTGGSRPKRTWGYTFPPFPVGSGLGAMPPPAVLSTLALGPAVATCHALDRAGGGFGRGGGDGGRAVCARGRDPSSAGEGSGPDLEGRVH